MKKIALIALALIAALTLSACGSTATFAEIDPDTYVTLGNYKNLKFQDRKTEATDFAVETELNAAMSELGYSTQHYDNTQEGGTVKINDILNIDYKGMKDGVAFEGGTAEGAELTIGSGAFIPGFEEQLVGVNVGETVNINLTFPAQYQSAELAGQDVVFQVTVNAITGKAEYPELTDKIAQEIDKEVKTADELRKKTKESVEASNKSEVEMLKKSTLWNQVFENCTFEKDLPASLLKPYIASCRATYETMAKQYNYDSLDKMLEASSVSKEDFEASLKIEGEMQAKNVLIGYAIAKAEGYTLSEEDFNESAKKYATAYGYSDPSTYINAKGRPMLEDQFVLDYAVALIIEKADITPAK